MTTLAYFPAAYPGELLYSLMARYHQYMGALSPIHTMEALYGERLVVASLDLPGHLLALADHLSAGAGWTGVRIARQLTLLPYYTAFQPSAVGRQARDAMLQGQMDGLLMRLGMATFRVKRVTTLQFCASCLRDMRGQYEEYYWRRDHQLPGVLVCPDHGCPLRASTVSLPTRGRHIYIAADDRTCPKGAPPLISCRSDEALADLQRVAIASRALLERPRAARPHMGWTRYYRQSLQRIGLAHSARRIDQQRLREDFQHHHRNALEHLPDLMAGKGFRGDWLAAMARKARGAFHPLQHVLLQDFLNHQEPHSGPFGEGPWPCLNPLAEHSGSAVISTVELHRNHDHRVGVFACDCGYVYTRSYFEVGGKVGLPRFQAYGPLLAPALRKMISLGDSLRRVADRLKLDPKTAVKLANDLGLATPWKPRAEGKRHDRVRSVETSRQPGRRLGAGSENRPCQRVDWPERDRQVSRQILRAAKVIRGQVPPVRICTLQIERRHWSRGWLSKRAGKLPKAMRRLRAVSESVQKFQRRRIEWVIREMDETDVPLRIWRILRKAGLGPQHAGLVNTLLEEHFASARRLTT